MLARGPAHRVWACCHAPLARSKVNSWEGGRAEEQGELMGGAEATKGRAEPRRH